MILVYNETSIYMNTQIEEKLGKFAYIIETEQLSNDNVILIYE